MSVAKKVFLLVIGIAALAAAFVLVRPKTENTAPVVEPDPKTVQLHYYNPAQDTDASGNVLCSDQGLVAVSRTVPGRANLAEVIKLQLAGELTEPERASGLTTEFPLPGLSVTGIEQTENEVVLTFADPQNRTSGGACRVTVLRAQIEKTAQAFTGVQTVRLLPEELFQP